MTASRRQRMADFINRTKAALDKHRDGAGHAASNSDHVRVSVEDDMASLGCRTTSEVNMRDAFTSLIADHFRQRPEQFLADLEKLHSSRRAATHAEDDETGIQQVANYYSDFSALAIKLPLHTGTNFIWRVQTPVVSDNPTFERASILYLLCAKYARMAAKANRSSLTGLKQAASFFQLSAGCAHHIEKHFASQLQPLAALDETLTKRYLDMIHNLMLAQAQECVWQKAAYDGLKDKLVAQLAQQAAEYYFLSLEQAQTLTTPPPTLIHYLSAKYQQFNAVAQLRMSLAAVSARSFGEEVARLQLAQDAASKSLSHAKAAGANIMKPVDALAKHITESLTRAEKDNNLIYLAAVPETGPLTAVPAISMVKAAKPDCVSKSTAGLFERLQPFVVRNVIDTYLDRRRRCILENEVKPLQHQLASLQSTLVKMGLPGKFMAIEQPDGLPASLCNHCDEFRRDGGLTALKRQSSQVQALMQANKGLLEQIDDVIDEENIEDQRLRAYYGSARWEREVSADFFSEQRGSLLRYRGLLDQAAASDQLVNDKLTAWMPQLEKLSLSVAELARMIPPARVTHDPRVVQCVEALKRLWLEWEAVQAERKAVLNEAICLSEQTSDDAFEAAALNRATVLQENNADALTPKDFEHSMQEFLQPYNERAAQLCESQANDDNLLSRFEELEQNLQHALNSTDAQDSPRGRALQELSQTWEKYQELRVNLDEGRKFYNDLHRALNRLGDEVQGLVEERMQEAIGARETIEHDEAAAAAAAAAQSSTTNSGTQRNKRSTWAPSDGIKFGRS
ncbi:Rhophilin-2 [Savitreella phatthalungensis]